MWYAFACVYLFMGCPYICVCDTSAGQCMWCAYNCVYLHLSVISVFVYTRGCDISLPVCVMSTCLFIPVNMICLYQDNTVYVMSPCLCKHVSVMSPCLWSDPNEDRAAPELPGEATDPPSCQVGYCTPGNKLNCTVLQSLYCTVLQSLYCTVLEAQECTPLYSRH